MKTYVLSEEGAETLASMLDDCDCGYCEDVPE